MEVLIPAQRSPRKIQNNALNFVAQYGHFLGMKSPPRLAESITRYRHFEKK